MYPSTPRILALAETGASLYSCGQDVLGSVVVPGCSREQTVIVGIGQYLSVGIQDHNEAELTNLGLLRRAVSQSSQWCYSTNNAAKAPKEVLIPVREADGRFYSGACSHGRYDSLICGAGSCAENIRIGNVLKAFAGTSILHPLFLDALLIDVGKNREQVLEFGKFAPKRVEGIVMGIALGRVGMRQNFDLLFSSVNFLGDFLAGNAGQKSQSLPLPIRDRRHQYVMAENAQYDGNAERDCAIGQQ